MKGSVLRLKIILYVRVAVMDRAAARFLDTEGVIKPNQRLHRIIGCVCKFLVADLLDCFILHAEDPQTAGIERRVRLARCVTGVFFKILKYLLDERVGVVGIDRGRTGLYVRLLDT